MRKNKKIGKIILYIVLITLAIIQITPLLAALMNSLRTNADIKKVAVAFPFHPQFSNFGKAWNIGGYFNAFANSMLVSISSSVVVLVFSIIGGYFLSRSNNKFSNYLLVYFGVSLSIPTFSFLVPLYYSFANLNLVNTHVGLILIYIAMNLPFNILLASTFVSGIPNALDEAAIIDGCSTYQVIAKIIFPLAKPVITTILLISFVNTWNEFTLANTFLQKPELKTAATKYVLFVGERGSDLSMIYTAGIITMLPIVLLFFFLQKYFIDGMTSGSVK
ncbi:ABC-type sugar transport system, permease component [Sphaerochaeta pleomorpha str. Grapes]|uniref:ABC-type sugar transport system, permease component n=1 Tax=Sphaerochaeta pleomorpha (strain ATCC BAA-1885 / DSM 22778 / Grapes) TaxID=158190 RepID=G8QQI2_SPHPG|nr:carbohydrate ABC transporter permease [Sphaerochaeta pleomorpha]AEV30912.1 ABC-type sugar transport system, permease component [Sphaerochaeta pleomorpha str. Grapes]